MKHSAHPIIDDASYSNSRHNRFFQRQFGCHRLLPACVEVHFRHPSTGAAMSIRAPLGGAFAQLCARFGWAAAAREFTDLES